MALAVCALAVLPMAVRPQAPEELVVRMRRAWQDHASVYLVRNTTVRIERGTDGYVANRRVEEQELMLKDQTGMAHEKEVGYSTFIPLEELEAFTLEPKGKGYKRMPVTTIDHRDERGDNIFHDDARVAAFVMPSLVTGSIAQVEYAISYPDARMVSGHFFAADHPVEESVFTVISDADLEVDIRTFHLADSLLERTVTTEKGRRVQRFTMRHVPALAYEEDAPTARYYAPHAQLVLRPRNAVPAEDLDRLYAWYMSYAKDIFAPPSPALKALSDSIVGDAGDARSRAVRVHRWVQDHIHYVAIEDGLNGMVPAAPEEVCRTRYGDCKGISHLLYTLLRAQELNAHLAWIGTRDLPYTYTELPSGASDNHMIVALELADSMLFLDGTANENAFGVPSGFIQGKQALVAMSSEHYEVHEVPVMPASFSALLDSVRVRLDGAALAGTGILRATGYERYQMARWLRNLSGTRLDATLRAILMKGSNTFMLDSSSVEGLDDPEAVLTVRYRFHIPDQVRLVNGRHYVSITLSDPWQDMRCRNDRRLPIEIAHCRSWHDVVTLDLPPGATCTGPPTEDSVETPAFGYAIRTTGSPGTVTSDARLAVNQLILDRELPDWGRANKALLRELGRTLVIDIP